jgi:hypothetical protein
VPTDVRFGIAVISSSKYAAKSVTATCFIVPSSFSTTLSASATVVDVADVLPSITFNSVAVEVTPSNIFNSAVVDVTPSNIFNSAAVEVTPSNIFNSAPVAVIAVPSKLNVSILAVPSINKSLNSKLDVPKSISLSVIGTIAPSCILNCCTAAEDTSLKRQNL